MLLLIYHGYIVAAFVLFSVTSTASTHLTSLTFYWKGA